LSERAFGLFDIYSFNRGLRAVFYTLILAPLFIILVYYYHLLRTIFLSLLLLYLRLEYLFRLILFRSSLSLSAFEPASAELPPHVKEELGQIHCTREKYDA
jgi:hypothetical protein